ncbi:transaldolase [Planctomycetaceae bacterium SCGC AG-212-F19]|nr:transaldolase [Planctomycetaceae bacterium SCGC AG-212-F19]
MHSADLSVKIFADGADLGVIADLARRPYIAGFTTNPTLMRKAGVTDYRAFAVQALKIVRELPISFEVFADEFDAMERQALAIASWAQNVYVKIPVTNTRAESSVPLIRRLSNAGIPVNVTALLTLDQVRDVAAALCPATPSYVSVFAGRIADTGRDPLPVMTRGLELLAGLPKAELIWASPRELLNVIQANDIGCHIITATPDILAKLALIGNDLDNYSLDTVRMFYHDACAAGYSIPTPAPAKAA